MPHSTAEYGWIMMVALALGCHAGPSVARADEEAATDGATTQPADEAKVDPQVEALLDRLEAEGKKIERFTTKIRWERRQALQDEKQVRRGRVTYLTGPPARFALRIDDLYVDGRSEELNKQYIFDGRYLVERDNRKNHRIFTRREVVKPDAPADDRDPLTHGTGFFVIPITTQKDLLLKRFDITLVEPKPDDDDKLKDTVHLHLVTKADHRADITQIDLWYDAKTLEPVRVQWMDDEENESIVQLSDTKINGKIDEDELDTTPPKERGWKVDLR